MRFINQLREYVQVIGIFSKGYLSISLLPPSKLNIILQKVREAVQINNRDYDLVIKRLYLYYSMKLVTFGIDEQRSLIVQFLVFVHLHTQQHLILYQMETVPVPSVDEKEQAQSYTYLQIRRPLIALNSETYYFNETDVKPAVLDGGHEIILTNWPSTKYVICNDNWNFPIKIPSLPYVLLKRTVLCNCGIEAENSFLLESIAACSGKQSALTMYYTVNTTFMHYFDSLTENLEIQISQNWTTQDQVFPVSLQTSEFDSKLLKAPKTLKDLVININKRNKY